MCGIAGYYSFGQSAEYRVDNMTQAQAHRGPDTWGRTIVDVGEGRLALGHRRLSIIDLSEAGNQPMRHPETGDIIVFNGEIYNFPELRDELESAGSRFRSASDTEVVLHAFAQWGTDCFSKLCGMFALAVYEASRRRLVLARDPLGIKPLYYVVAPGGLAFASELRALMKSGLIPFKINRKGLTGFLSYGAVQEPLTLVEEARLMPSGTWGAIDLSGPLPNDIDFHDHWRFPPGLAQVNREEAVYEVSNLLDRAVIRHLLSDVPVAVFLSGGLDSSAVATLAAKTNPAIQAFTVSLTDKSLDESETASETAGLLGIRHRTLRLDDDDVLHHAVKYFAAIDQPTIDGLNTFLISGAVRRAGIKVALSGLGGDELFGGYSAFARIRSWLTWARRLGRIPGPVRVGLARMAFLGLPIPQRFKALDIVAAEPSIFNFGFLRRRLFSNTELRKFGIEPDELGTIKSPNGLGYSRAAMDRLDDDPIAALCVLESIGYMRNMLLRDADVFSMAHGLEIRVPFLDRDLIDFVFALPGYMKTPNQGVNKPLLVDAMTGRLPQGLIKLPKQGFSVMQHELLRGPLKDFCENALSKSTEILDADTVWRLWREFHRNGKDRLWSRVWACATLGVWQSNISSCIEECPHESID